MAEQMNIYQKLARIRKQVEVIQKNKSGYGYKYVSEDEILAKISVFMDKYGLSLIPNIKQGSTIVSPYTYKKTKTMPIRSVFELRCLNGGCPEVNTSSIESGKSSPRVSRQSSI